ncbi:hypothetical protein AB0395_27830 [Streptosporangium sp. NPDC051023]|uniref:hypothetical protein n=1 Tax=Streptosporangium sp. NPDC051023 TaxID=3155410 RepID=UPI00344CF629
MAIELEELFARQVDIGIATMSTPDGDGADGAHVVVQRIAAIDGKTGQERHLLLVYQPDGVTAMVDVLRQAAEKAMEGTP